MKGFRHLCDCSVCLHCSYVALFCVGVVLSNAALKPSEQAIRINQKCAGRHSVEKERGIAYLLARRISYNFFHKLNSLTCEKFSDRITHFLLVGCKNTWLVQRRITIEQQLSCHATGSTNWKCHGWIPGRISQQFKGAGDDVLDIQSIMVILNNCRETYIPSSHHSIEQRTCAEASPSPVHKAWSLGSLLTGRKEFQRHCHP